MFTLAAQSSPVNGIVLVLIYALIFGGFWFLFIRPQKKEQKRVQAMIAEMEVGDAVLTSVSQCRKQQLHRSRKHLLNKRYN